ncbi:MAG: polysaccharide deacetylase family protein [Vulcanimicrobiota bacterium]
MTITRITRSLGIFYHRALARKNFLNVCGNALPTLKGTGGILLLSFDCDTDDDMKALPELTRLLTYFGFSASFALCGELARSYERQTRDLIAQGYEIVNHGYSRHCAPGRNGAWESSLSYRNLTDDSIRREILDCHRMFSTVFKAQPRGFRTPHFGTFQKTEDLERIYAVLSSLGYTYSTSTCGFAYPYAFHQNKRLFEIPLTPCPWHDRTPFDSWHIIKAPGREHRSSDLWKLFSSMVKWLEQDVKRFVINLYFDPSHVLGEPETFNRFLGICRERKLTSLSYSDFLRGELDRGGPLDCFSHAAVSESIRNRGISPSL